MVVIDEVLFYLYKIKINLIKLKKKKKKLVDLFLREPS